MANTGNAKPMVGRLLAPMKMSMIVGSPSRAFAIALRILPVMGGIDGVLTMGLPSASVSPKPATPTRSTLASISPAVGGGLKPARSAVATRRLRR